MELEKMNSILTVEEVAVFLRTNRNTIYRLIAKSQLTAFKVGSELRITKTAVANFIHEQEATYGSKQTNLTVPVLRYL